MNLINLTKKAWQIRKAAAARFGVGVMTISWKLCLDLAGEKEMNLKDALETAGFTVRTNGGAMAAIRGKRPTRTDVDFDAIGGKFILVFRQNGEEKEMAVSDEAAAIAALQAAGIL